MQIVARFIDLQKVYDSVDREIVLLAVCVLHVKPLSLPVDIRHDQYPCRVFNPREIQVMWSQNYARDAINSNTLIRYAVSTVQ